MFLKFVLKERAAQAGLMNTMNSSKQTKKAMDKAG